MTLTVGTDTYVSLADADTYFSSRPFSTSWTTAASSLKEGCLKAATTHLDLTWDWRGFPTDEDQLLMFPRNGLYTPRGAVIPITTVPPDIVTAQLELAYQWVQADQLAPPGTHLTGVDAAAMKGGVKIEKVGSLMREYFGPPTMFAFGGGQTVVRKRYPLVELLVRPYSYGRRDINRFPNITT